MTPFYKNIALWLVICLMMIMLFQIFKQPNGEARVVSYSEFHEPWWSAETSSR